jgi:signal transduction histidine kinase
MMLPSFNDIPSYTLSYANNGRRLFNHHDAQLANTSALFFQHLAQSKQAFQEGVTTERQRLARDLHDDIGAKLLSLIYSSNDEKSADSARAVLHELRSVIQALETDTISSEQFAAQLSTEINQRCNEADIKMSWQQRLSDFDISSRHWRNLRTACREIVSNILKHSQCTIITVDLSINQQQLTINIADNGVGFDTEQPATGHGLNNIRQRVDEINGQFTLQSTTATTTTSDSGSCFIITLRQGV